MKIPKRLSAILLATAIIMLTSCQTKRTYSNDITTLSDQASSTTVVDITKETAVQAATVPATTGLTAVSATAAATTKTPADPYKTALTYCVDTDRFSQQKNIDKRIYPASMTKFLTACTALKYVKPDAKFTVGSEQDMVRPNPACALFKRATC